MAHINGHAIGHKFAYPWQVTLAERYFDHIGGFGVCAFFCISGFLILQSLLRHRDLWAFARSRVLRIYPLFLVLTALWFPYVLLFEAEFRSFKSDPPLILVHLVSNVLFLPGIFNLPIAQNLAWTLSFEAAFYVVSAIWLLGWIASTSTKRGAALTVGFVLTFALLLLRPYTWYFLLGVGAYFLLKHRPEPAAWLKWGPTGIVAIVVAYIFMPEGWRTVPPTPYQMRSQITEPINDRIRWEYFWESLHQWPIALAAAAVFFTSVAYQVGWLAEILKSKAIRFLGLVSYSMYLTHGLVLKTMVYAVRPLPHAWESATYTIGSIVLSVVVAWASYVLIEVRLTRLIANRIPNPARQGA